jgi:hypothetical protein
MMLRQAIVALGPRTMVPVALVGSALIGLAALFVPSPSSSIYRFTLHAPEQPRTLYISAWNDGDVFVDHDGSDGKTLTFTRRADEHDGCRWQGTETLTPIGARAYLYSYDEKILSCEADARPFERTPRRGIVTVEKMDEPMALTALEDVQAPGDLWALDDSDDDEGLTVTIEDSDDAADSDCHCGCDADFDDVAADADDADEDDDSADVRVHH